MNYFNKAKVNWNTWSPESIIFKSNQLVKQVLPPENVLSWSTKGDRDHKMCKLTGGKVQQGYGGRTYHGWENYKGVMVQLKDLKNDFPYANIDFIDRRERKDSVGNNYGQLDVLVYLNSFHTSFEYIKCPQTNQYVKKIKNNKVPLDEGYRMCYGGQGDANSMPFQEFKELIEITEAIKNFLVEVIVPINRNELTPDEYELMVA